MNPTTSRTLVAVLLVLLIVGGIAYYMKRDTDFVSIQSYEECVQAGYPVAESYPEQCRTPDGRVFTNTTSTPTPSNGTSTAATSTGTGTSSTNGDTAGTGGNATAAEIRNVNVSVNQAVTSPLTITGEAKGWYFEASFPMQLLDGNGKVIAQGPAQAQGDWMTSAFVPFKSTLAFAKPSTATGTLILRNDNPSGLPENARELRIPVRFGTSVSSGVQVQIQ